LLRAVCDEFWMVGRGKVEPFDGDLDDYQKYLLEESKRLREVAKNAAREPAAASASASASAVVKPATPVQVAEPEKVAAVVASPVVSGLSSADQRKLDARKRQQLAAQTRPLKRELEQNEQRMASIETEKNRLEALLTTPVSPAEMADAGRRLKALADEVATLEERWLELTSLLEEATAM
jgi:ATP-binding cassette subfamily F protein 3